MEPTAIELRAIRPDEKEWVERLAIQEWGAPVAACHGTIYAIAELPGLVAIQRGERVGLLTYHLEGDSLEVVTINSLKRHMGIGTALLAAATGLAKERGCRRLWLITTNDNLDAIRFYQRRGMELVRVHRHAVTRARVRKPEIPMFGDFGIPIRDEIELELRV